MTKSAYLMRAFGWLMLVLGLGIYLPQAKATHAMGVDLTYTCLGNNQYRLNLTVYRDCNGINLTPSQTIQWNSSSLGLSGAVSLNAISNTEITPVCPGVVGSACMNTGIYGIQRWVYEGVVTLPANAPDIRLSWNLCCRNHAITTLSTPGSNNMFISIMMSTANGLCNNSPVFLNNPTPFACANQPVFYNHGVMDTDGDSLRFSLAPCYQGNGQVVSYGPGRSASNPLVTQNGITIDPATGALSFVPSQPQVGVLCVLVEEFRNGQKIGEVVRDIQFTVLNCVNTVPTLSGINGTSNYSTQGQVGQQLCFDMLSSDPDQDQTLTLTYNQAIPSANFTSSAGPRPTGTFCWTPQAAGTYSFTVNVADNFCPLVGQNTYTYTINVAAAPIDTTPAPCSGLQFNVVSTQDLRCNASDGAAVLTASGGTAPYNYQVVNWTTGQFYNNNSGIFNNLSAGNYGVWITDANGCTLDCVGTGFVIGGRVRGLNAQVQVQPARCFGDSNFIQVTANGGTAPYLYAFNGSGFSPNGQFVTVQAGTVQVLVVDANGCNYTQSVQVQSPQALVLSAGTIVQPTCGQSTGSITLFATGGTMPYHYMLNNRASMTVAGNFFGQLAGGYYMAEVTDANGCRADLFIQLQSTASITASITTRDVSCPGSCDGRAVLDVQGGQAPLQITWSHGGQGQSLGSLCAGSYTATVRDAQGCEASASGQVQEPSALSVSLVSSVDPDCNQSNGSAVLQGVGGTAPYQYQVANFTAGQVFNNNTGNFNNMAAGQYTAQIVDANGCRQDCASTFVLHACQGGLQTNSGSGNLIRSNNYFLLSPNPASTLAQVSYSFVEQKSLNLTIVDETGRQVYQQSQMASQGSIELNISTWTGAAYFLILRNEQGEVMGSQKLIIRR